MAVERTKVALLVCSVSAVIVGLTLWNEPGYPVTAVFAKASVFLGCLLLLLGAAGKVPVKRRPKNDRT